MPIYEYGCECGHAFERRLRTPDSPDPACPSCGGVPRRRLPSSVAMLGRATLPPGADSAPRSWQETNGGDRETVLHWQRTLEQRQKIEDRHPELASRTSPVLAHEGRYAASPLRADAGHSHPRAHPHPA